MTLSLWLRLWGSCTILVMLVTSLGFPFGAVRRWLNRGAYVAHLNNAQGEFFAAVRGDQQLTDWLVSAQEAARALRWWERLRNWAGDLVTCPYCFAGWATLAAVLVFVDGTVWDRVTWWGPLWVASAGLVVTLNAIGDA